MINEDGTKPEFKIKSIRKSEVSDSTLEFEFEFLKSLKNAQIIITDRNKEIQSLEYPLPLKTGEGKDLPDGERTLGTLAMKDGKLEVGPLNLSVD